MRQDIAWFDNNDPKEMPTRIAEKVFYELGLTSRYT